ncbi:MAG: metalloregulator ArsR/SmtB family transcription factor, partial [Lentisphaerota bacterium]
IMHDFMNIAKALSDQNRVRVLLALTGRELCVCQIIELLGLAPSTVSKHMSILKNARLVEWRKEGLWMHYSLPDKPTPEIKTAIAWICDALEDNKTVKRDRGQLKKILKMDVEDICKRQNDKTCCKTKGRAGNGK